MTLAEEFDAPTRDAGDQRKEFLEQRATIIGATDSPKILGLSRYGTALTVYNEKIAPPPVRDMSLPAWLGLRLQATVGEMYSTATGLRLRADNRLHRMPDYPYVGCHLDFRVWGHPKRLVECKTRAYMSGWGEEGSGRIPVEIWVQVQHEMMVTGAELCDVAVLFGHHTFRVYPVERDQRFIDALLPKLIDFRERNWLARVPPLPTGHDLDKDIVQEENPEHTDEIKAATPEQIALVEQYRLARLNAVQAAATRDGLQYRIQQIIGTAAGITGPFGTITWKRTRDGKAVAWEQVATAYRKAIETVVRRLPEAQPVLDEVGCHDPETIVSIYTSVKPGSRRINVQLTEEN